jgi:LAO/AO transport system kinase
VHRLSDPVLDWVAALRDGDRKSLARAITEVENETPTGNALIRAIHDHLGRAHIVGFTGPPGAGKSTLINAFVGELNRRGKRVGVVAVDPSSPISGGAILGDRVRMGDVGGSDDVFIRSLASRGHLGGLSRTASRVVDLLDAAGMDYVILETVGTGQSEIEVAGLALTKVVLFPPGAGDDVQAQKAGVLEIADILAINKADLALADRAQQQLRQMLALRKVRGWTPIIVRTVATRAQGIDTLFDAIAKHYEWLTQRGVPLRQMRLKTVLAQVAGDVLRRRIEVMESPQLERLCADLDSGEIDYGEAAERALAIAAAGGRVDATGTCGQSLRAE